MSRNQWENFRENKNKKMVKILKVPQPTIFLEQTLDYAIGPRFK